MIRLPHHDKDIADLAQQIVNDPAAIEAARLCAADLGLPGGSAFLKLRVWLARNYAHGYVMGREGRASAPQRPITPDPLGRG